MTAVSTTIQRRTIRTLMVGQALGVAAIASAVAVMPLLAADVLGSDRWAGLPSAMLTLGTATAAAPLARRASTAGRRPALSVGFLVGAIGGLAAALAGERTIFLGLLAGMFVFGAGQGSTLQNRFAATDLAEPEQYGTAISLVVWVGTLGGLVGPVLTPLVENLGDSAGLSPHIGPILAAAGLYVLASSWISWQLRPDPLVLAGGLSTDTSRRRRLADLASTLRQLSGYPLAVLGLVAIVLSQAAMVAVMTMTPLHMRDHGQGGLSALVIALHILGMYGLAPFVGKFTDRVGRLRAIETGGLVLAGGTVAAVIAGYQPVLIFVGLFLLGLGWNFGLIAGSALLNESVPDEIKVRAQGASDVLLSLFGATAAITSGIIKQGAGFHWLANLATGLAVFVVFWAMSVSRRPPALVPPG